MPVYAPWTRLGRVLKAGAAPLAVVILIVAAAPHLPFLTGGCITDDAVHLARLESLPWREVLSTADAFGFYRPLQQATYLLDAAVSGHDCGATSRIINLILHLGVAASVFVLARLVLPSTSLAPIAALMFVLAPKVSSTVVFWISARAELLMTLFAVLATIAWVKWIRGGHAAWLGAAAAAYMLSLLGKESALLLPLALLFVPQPSRPRADRIIGYVVLGAATLGLTLIHVGAVPFTETLDEGRYAVNAARLFRSLQSYAGRAIIAPALVVMAIAIAGRSRPRMMSRDSPAVRAVIFGLAWFIAIIGPALPIVLRSEVRLYAPAIGLALAGAAIASSMMNAGRIPVAALAVVTMVLGGYQATRSFGEAQAARFSRALVAALRADRALGAYDGPIALTAADEPTDRLLRNGVGGYATLVVARALHPEALDEPPPVVDRRNTLTVRCLARDGTVTLTIDR